MQRFTNITTDQQRLRLFPYSLKDNAKAWLHALPENTITTWDEMSKTFLSKYYPAQRTNAIRKEMMQFAQYSGESFHECWERYKNLYVQCPHHGFSDWQKVQHFYEGLLPESKNTVDSAVGGSLVAKTPEEALKTFEMISENSQQWNFNPRASKSAAAMNPYGGNEWEEKYRQQQEKMEAMERQLQRLAMNKTQATCSFCYSSDHLSIDCHMQPPSTEEANFVNAGWRRPEQQGYNQNQRQHPGFQWSNPQGGQYAPAAPYQPPHMRQNQFQAPAQTANTPTKNIEEMFAAIMGKTTVYDQKFNNMEAALSKLEIQVGQLANNMNQQEPGRFPSQPEVNPREPEHVKDITNLRSGRIIENKVDHFIAPEIEEEHEHEHEATVDDESTPLKEKEAADLMKPADLEHYKETTPFPHLLAKRKKDSEHMIFWRFLRKWKSTFHC